MYANSQLQSWALQRDWKNKIIERVSCIIWCFYPWVCVKEAFVRLSSSGWHSPTTSTSFFMCATKCHNGLYKSVPNCPCLCDSFPLAAVLSQTGKDIYTLFAFKCGTLYEQVCFQNIPDPAQKGFHMPPKHQLSHSQAAVFEHPRCHRGMSSVLTWPCDFCPLNEKSNHVSKMGDKHLIYSLSPTLKLSTGKHS